MDYFSILIFVLLLVFLGFEGKNAIKSLVEHKKQVKQIQETKKGVVVCKDYQKIVLLYGALAIAIVFYSFYYYQMKMATFAIIFSVMPLFCIIFILEAIVTRTIVFYESGFLFSGKTYKYRSVLKISNKKKFVRGYHVQMINDEDLIYVTKKSKPLLEEKLKEFKDRKKHKHEK